MKNSRVARKGARRCRLAERCGPSVRLLHGGCWLERLMANVALAGGMLMSPEEFLVYPLDDDQAELVRGELRVTPPPGGAHNCVVLNLAALLLAHAKRH